MNSENECQKQELIAKLSQKPAAEIAGILSDVLCDYVLQNQEPFEAEKAGKLAELPGNDYQSFAHLMEDVIRKYRFPELRRFRVEGYKVYYMFHDREIEIKSQMEALLKSAPAPASQTSKPQAVNNNHQFGESSESLPIQDNTRFKNLEL